MHTSVTHDFLGNSEPGKYAQNIASVTETDSTTSSGMASGSLVAKSIRVRVHLSPSADEVERGPTTCTDTGEGFSNDH